VCSGFQSGAVLNITSPLMVIPLARAWSRATVTSRPLLLVPSPDTSIARRVASNGARSSCWNLSALSSLFDYLCERNVIGSPVDGVKR
jgi:hypothetical protein